LATRQLKFPRYHGLGEVALADKVGHYENLLDLFGIEEEKCIPPTRFFLPKSAFDLIENFPLPDLGCLP
jgi:hypothetical protein